MEELIHARDAKNISRQAQSIKEISKSIIHTSKSGETELYLTGIADFLIDKLEKNGYKIERKDKLKDLHNIIISW